MRVGNGYDVHQLTAGRPLILGGVTIPYEKGLKGHSDADVLIHAIMDALLGAAGLKDIGSYFPDTAEAYRGADSLKLLGQVAEMIKEKNFKIENIDSVIAAQRPKLAPYIPQMKENISRVLEIEINQIGIKATTTEHLGFEGRGEGISAYAVALMDNQK